VVLRKPRTEITEKLHAEIERGRMLLSFGAGIGLTAVSAERGGADLIGVYSTAVYRMRGIPSLAAFLPYGNANEHMWRMASEILPVVRETPCVAGIGAHDPQLDLTDAIERAAHYGFSGITNEPFVGIYGSEFAGQLERAGLGFSREVELISLASEAEMLTFAWAFTPEEARAMVAAGADAIGAIVGVTAGGMTGTFDAEPLDVATQQVGEIAAAALEANPATMVFSHGGAIADPASAGHVFEKTACVGYAAGSSGERIPTEQAVTGLVKDFKGVVR